MLSHWDLIENDLQDAGVDVGNATLMTTRSWRWLRARILGLLTTPVGHDLVGEPVFASRLQAVLTPRPDESRRAHES